MKKKEKTDIHVCIILLNMSIEYITVPGEVILESSIYKIINCKYLNNYIYFVNAEENNIHYVNNRCRI